MALHACAGCAHHTAMKQGGAATTRPDSAYEMFGILPDHHHLSSFSSASMLPATLSSLTSGRASRLRPFLVTVP
jgi:hypothetical protein